MESCYTMTIAGKKRNLPLFQVNDKLQIAAFIMLGDVEITTACAEALSKKIPGFDIILTAEAKGIPLAHELARITNHPYEVARKSPKVYMRNIISTEVDSITTAGKQKLFLGEDAAAKLSGKNVLILDDVISTGQSLAALEKLVSLCGGNVCGRAAVLAEGDASDRSDIIYLERLPLFGSDGKPLLQNI